MKNKFRNKKILIGLTGAVAIYKSCLLIRRLKKLGCEVRCIMTNCATKFINPLLFEQLSANKVYLDLFDNYEYSPEHISLSNWADIIIVVPCSLNTISKISTAKAEDLLSCVVLATDLKRKKVILCPSMNTNMWENKITQQNISFLRKVGYIILDPAVGDLLCDSSGSGRLPEVDEIMLFLEKHL